jgi:hypothetical protein
MPAISPSVLLGLLGALLCVFGFSLYWGGLRVLAMFVGGSVGAVLGIIIAYVARPERTVSIIIILAIAVIGMFIGWRLLRGGHGFLVLIIGAVLGYLLDKAVLAPYYGGFWAQSWVPFAAAVVGGVLFSLLFRYIIILVTCAVGAYLLFQAVGQPWVLFVAFFGGLLVQVGLFHRMGLHRKVQTRWS